MPDLLVTGTDTGVGKTVVAAALLMAFRDRGTRAIGFKPAESGIQTAEISDSDVLAEASAEQTPLVRPLLSLAEPLAPAVAAERAGVTLDPQALEDRVGALRAAGFTLVVEGAGGLLVPLAWDYTILDLAAHAGLATIVVARAGLGTLNHVALTVAMLQHRRVAVRGVVLNGRSENHDLPETTNPGALARLIPGIPIIVIPRHAAKDPAAAARASVPFVERLV
ncbi:MAG: dethiobiotin synthase [Acidobacteria bacterium]|nr:dethiobiotin synthase [Acidobacteriota bacterium]